MMVSWFQLIISLIVFVVSGLAAVARVSWVVRGMKDEIQADCKRMVDEALKHDEEKRGAIFRRLDEVKLNMDMKFVNKEVCQVMHNETARVVARLDVKMEAFIERTDKKFRIWLKCYPNIFYKNRRSE
jgi:hypothetical protein